MSIIDISQEQRALYRDEGYMILERAIPEHYLELLRVQCQEAIEQMDARMASTIAAAATSSLTVLKSNRYCANFSLAS